MMNVFRRNRGFAAFEKRLGGPGLEFLAHALTSVTRLLPHTETDSWQLHKGAAQRLAWWTDSNRRELALACNLILGQECYHLSSTLRRKCAPAGAGNIPRTLDQRERDLCERAMELPATVLRQGDGANLASLKAIQARFDEQIVASHLEQHHHLRLDVGEILRALRELAEQSYENKSLTFGCLLDPRNNAKPGEASAFPKAVLARKKYRALSDGYRTAYRVSAEGSVIGFEDLPMPRRQTGTHYYPEWSDRIASASHDGVCGICLTRQGDILVFDGGTMRLTYRFGRWQYWNHHHIVDILTNRARVQRVPPRLIGSVVNSIYRAALDVSFRRCGGLFVLLHNRRNVAEMVHPGDEISNSRRDALDGDFDEALPSRNIRTMPRCIMVELAGLDGGVVLNNLGDVLAYAAVLSPRRKGKIGSTEGSRSKAAIGASNYGVAVKISSDGDIKFYENGKVFFGE